MKLIISSSPHIASAQSTRKIMLDVIIALMLPLIGGIYYFGVRALLVAAISVISAVGAEYIACKVAKKKNTISDLSAVVTGLILALCCPVSVPFWMVIIGNIFAIVIVKACFGGIGKNFVNPAIAARAFMLASFPAAMTNWGISADAVSSATPLMAKAGEYSYLNLFLGKNPGCIGETSVALILLGFIYLLIQKVIDFRIPVCYMATLALFTFIFGKGGVSGDALYQVLSGGALFGAVFMATDYTTSPISKWGHVVFAVGCGLLTGLIRLFGNLPEGVTYAIMIMNALVPFIDKITLPKKFGMEGK